MRERARRPEYHLIKTTRPGEKYYAINSNARFGAPSPKKLGRMVAGHANDHPSSQEIDGINFHTFSDKEVRKFLEGLLSYEEETL